MPAVASESPRLVVIGGGPKAIAIAAKARVLGELGWRVPEVVAVEGCGLAANWDGRNGYTDGKLILGTTALEDVGFPYRSDHGPAVDGAMLAYSYVAYRVECGDYAEWVDRGLPAPTHGVLGDYLRWAAEKADLFVIEAVATRVAACDGSWIVDYRGDSGTGQVVADGLVLTGPGEPFRVPRRGSATTLDERAYDGRTFWTNTKRFGGLADSRIAVVGGGETSAAIATYLSETVDGSSRIEIITRHPVLFTRNEHWIEVMYFSTANGWEDLSEREKTEVIRHADRGTFSVEAKRALDKASNVAVQIGELEAIEAVGDELRVALSRTGGRRSVNYDYVIEATGFDPMSVLALVEGWSLIDGQTPLTDRIGRDLSVADYTPKLHLPGLAAMAQGPGFPNLSCLGMLSDRILASYLDS
jgi:mycobactin lysine-N-oxygenase